MILRSVADMHAIRKPMIRYVLNFKFVNEYISLLRYDFKFYSGKYEYEYVDWLTNSFFMVYQLITDYLKPDNV